jgi:hypothetical protein
MKGEFLLLFVILLLGLILCSFLGRNSYIEGMEVNKVYYGPNGKSAVFKVDSNGNNTLVVTNSDGTTVVYTADETNSNIYKGPDGGTAVVKDGENGTFVQIRDSYNNVVLTLTQNENTGVSTASTSSNAVVSTDYDNYSHYDGSSHPTIFYGPDGGTAKLVQTDYENVIVITNKNGVTEKYVIDKNSDVDVYYGPNGGTAKIITTDSGDKAIQVTTPYGNKIVYTSKNVYTYNNYDDTINKYDVYNDNVGTPVDVDTYYGPHGGQVTTVSGPAGNTYSTYDSSAYYNSLPEGIPKSKIPPGQEDLYILKSQVVPPVCPGPVVIEKCSEKTDLGKCPPCPPCSRCPEPNFTCEKVPNYNAFNPDTFPVPVLSDFSSFGM